MGRRTCFRRAATPTKPRIISAQALGSGVAPTIESWNVLPAWLNIELPNTIALQPPSAAQPGPNAAVLSQ